MADTTARDAIASGVRYEGLTVYVVADATNYQLVGGITNGDWVEVGAGGSSSIAKNYARNPEFLHFNIFPDPTTEKTFQDGQLAFDDWYVLTSGGATNISVVQSAYSVSGAYTKYAVGLRQSDATARRFGIIQKIPSGVAQALRGKNLVFSFRGRDPNSVIPNLRAGVVEWTGTIDTMPVDVVSSWGSTPTLVAGAAFLNTPGDLAITNAALPVKFDIPVTVGATANELALFIWTEAEEANTNNFSLKEVMFTEGTESPANFSDTVPLKYDRDIGRQEWVGKVFNGQGSTNTEIFRFTNIETNVGGDITYADSATLGASFTINTAGVYALYLQGRASGVGEQWFAVLNASAFTSGTSTNTLMHWEQSVANTVQCGTTTTYLAAGDVVRFGCAGNGEVQGHARIVRVG